MYIYLIITLINTVHTAKTPGSNKAKQYKTPFLTPRRRDTMRAEYKTPFGRKIARTFGSNWQGEAGFCESKKYYCLY